MSPKTADLLAALPRHPGDDKIAYCPDNPSIYVPLVREGCLRAAIIPCPDRPTFDKGANDAAYDFFDLYRANPTFPNITMAAFYPLHLIGGRIHTDFYSGQDITSYFDPIILNGLKRCFAAATFGQAEEKGWDVMVLASPEQSGRDGINPRFHEDEDLIAYMSFFGGNLEYIVGDITPDIKAAIKDMARASKEEMQEAIPPLRGRIHTLDHGDMMYFGNTLMHRSSTKIPSAGQLAFTL